MNLDRVALAIVLALMFAAFTFLVVEAAEGDDRPWIPHYCSNDAWRLCAWV